MFRIARRGGCGLRTSGLNGIVELGSVMHGEQAFSKYRAPSSKEEMATGGEALLVRVLASFFRVWKNAGAEALSLSVRKVR
jgi:hypothetical protein